MGRASNPEVRVAERSESFRDDTFLTGEVVGRMSYEEFLEVAERDDRRYEDVEGVVYALATPVLRHARIAGNITAALRAVRRAGGCEVFSQGASVRTPRGNVYVPDVIVRCGARVSDDVRHIEDPCVLVEVLSPSTTRTDLGDKRANYPEFASLQAYLVVEQAWRCVHVYRRDASGAWPAAPVETVEGFAGEVRLPCPVGAVLTLDAIYEDVDAPAERPRLRRVREEGAEAYASWEPSDEG